MGNRTRVKVVKNKLAAPFRDHEFDVLYGKGISRHGDILDLGTDIGIIDKAGSWYSYMGDRLGQGREQSMNFLREHTDLTQSIEERIRLHFGLIPQSGEEPAAPVAAPAEAAPKKKNSSKRSRAEAN